MSISDMTLAITGLGVGHATVWRDEPGMGVMLLALALLVFWKHRENVARLRDGTEPHVGQKDRAFEALKKASSAGFSQVSWLESEGDLAPLRTDARFKEAVTDADRNARPCVYRTESRAFDFWVGDWDVTVNGAPAGESHVERILGDCVIFENWTGANGFSGKSLNFFDAPKKRWQQTWVDNVGGLLEFYGEAKDDRVAFAGEGVPPGQAAPVKNRMTFFNKGANEVRQLIEQSSDDGQTWTVTFDGTYKRKK